MRLPGRLLVLLIPAGFVVQAHLALCHVAPLTSDTRDRLAKAAQNSAVSLGLAADFNLIMYDNEPLEWIKYDGIHARVTFHNASM